jgi:hypothetical protein
MELIQSSAIDVKHANTVEGEERLCDFLWTYRVFLLCVIYNYLLLLHIICFMFSETAI